VIKTIGVIINDTYINLLISNVPMDEFKQSKLKETIIKQFDNYTNFIYFLITKCSTSIKAIDFNSLNFDKLNPVIETFDLKPDDMYVLDVYNSIYSSLHREPYSVFNSTFYDLLIEDMYKTHLDIFNDKTDIVIEEYVYLLEHIYKHIEDTIFNSIYQQEVINEDILLIIRLINNNNLLALTIQ